MKAPTFELQRNSMKDPYGGVRFDINIGFILKLLQFERIVCSSATYG